MAFWDRWLNPKSDQQELQRALDDRRAVEKLIALGANPNASSSGGMTALQHAVMNGDHGTLKVLLDAGGQVDFNSAALKAAVDAGMVPAQPEQPAVDTSGDIEIRKPLTYKPKA